jgi:hypothetical protein
MPRRFDLFNIRVPDEKVHLANRRMAQQGVQEAFIRGKEPVMTLPTAGRNGKNCADGSLWQTGWPADSSLIAQCGQAAEW